MDGDGEPEVLSESAFEEALEADYIVAEQIVSSGGKLTPFYRVANEGALSELVQPEQ